MNEPITVRSNSNDRLGENDMTDSNWSNKEPKYQLNPSDPAASPDDDGTMITEIGGFVTVVGKRNGRTVSMEFEEHDLLRGPDGREWIVTNANEKTMGRHFVRLESVTDGSEEIGVPARSIFDYEVLG